MPVKIRKLPNKNKWEVIDKKGHHHSFKTTKSKAEAQVRLLRGISHGMKLRKKN
jgi:hypothetical protein